LPNSQIELNPGMRLGVRGGYGLTDWLSGEVETGFTVNSIDSITGSIESNGTLANVPLLLNARLHLPDNNRISPYLGAGFGLSSTILTGNDIQIGGTRLEGSTADVVFAYQLFAGVDFAINDQMSVGLEYRFFHADESNMSADLAVGTPTDRVKLGEIETHAVTVNFTWRF
jgi:opacity protein-like surface antigen